MTQKEILNRRQDDPQWRHQNVLCWSLPLSTPNARHLKIHKGAPFHIRESNRDHKEKIRENKSDEVEQLE